MQKNNRHVVLLCLLGFLLCSIFSIGFHHYDEHFQILEFAALKLNLCSPENLPWEYHNQMRPAIQPAMVVALYKLLSLIGLGSPFVISFLLRLLSAALAFTGMWYMYKVYVNTFSEARLKQWFVLFSFLLWFSFYLGVRFSSENWSGIAFVLAFCLFFLAKKQRAMLYITIGLLLGASFVFRYQAGFLAFGFFCWMAFVKKEKKLNLLLLASAALFMAFIGVLIDYWFYGEWTLTAWNYVDQNLLQDKVSGFGTEPWWWYFTAFSLQAVPPLSLLFLGALMVLVMLKPKSPIIWSLLPFLLIHILIGHKELRFLFPVVFFLPVLLIQAIQSLQEKYNLSLQHKKWFRVLIQFSLVLNFLFLAVVLVKPADSTTALYQSIHNNFQGPGTLYYTDENPYHRVLDVHFYKRPNLQVQKLNTSESLLQDNTQHTLVAYKNTNLPEVIPSNYTLVYSSFPNWIKAFNLNNWQERTDMWLVYEVKPDESNVR